MWNFNYLTLTSSLDSSWSNDELVSTETVYLGGASTIRGYRNESIIGNSGFNVRNDLNFNLSKIFDSENFWYKSFTPGIFADFGSVYSKDTGNSKIAGSGLKLAFKYWLIDATATYAKIIDRQNWMTENYNIYFYMGLSGRF